MKGKIKLPRDYTRIIIYLAVKKNIKGFSEINEGTKRIYDAGKEMLKKGILKKEKGLISINYSKYPELKATQEYFDVMLKSEDMQERKQSLGEKGFDDFLFSTFTPELFDTSFLTQQYKVREKIKQNMKESLKAKKVN